MSNIEKQNEVKSYKGLSIFLALLCLCLVVALFYLSGRISDLRENVSNNYEQISDQETQIHIQEAKIKNLILRPKLFISSIQKIHLTAIKNLI